jgi:hypothetical protein
MGNPAGLYRNGWKKEDLKIGGTATVAGWLAKDGKPHVNANTITMEGKKLFAGSSAGNDDGYGEKK